VAAIAACGTSAFAHDAIAVLIDEPQPGQRTGADVAVNVFAQAALDGVDETVFYLELDGEPVDDAPEQSIRVGERKRFELEGLSKGEHVVTLVYRPDTDMPFREIPIRFTVGDTPRWIGLATAATLVVLLVFVVGRFSRAGRP
jgi:hypothetical protein